MKRLKVIIIFLLVSVSLFPQTVLVTDDASATAGHASSVLDVKSTSKGLLIPRMNLAQRVAISSPANGLMVFQTDGTSGFYSYASGSWSIVGGSTANGSETLIDVGTHISKTGIGTTGSPYSLSYATQSVTIAERNALTGNYAGRYIWCNNCGTSGEFQIYNGSGWTNASGTTAVVTTDSPSSVKSTTATAGGNVTSDGGNSVTERGVCWSTSINPTIYSNKKTNGTGTGSFSPINLTNLSPSTTYHIRAYATNSTGTSYGSDISFTTSAYAIGDPCQGGIVAYLDGGGGGMVAATSDNNYSGVPLAWWNGAGVSTGATATSIGNGDANTRKIMATAGGSGSYAAKYCSDYSVVDGGITYNDWFLPSKDELLQLYNNKTTIGNFQAQWYWSSTETNASTAVTRAFGTGTSYDRDKSTGYYVRAVREIIGLGLNYGGGKIAYLFQPGDAGYVAGEYHGLIVSTTDLSTGAYWGCGGTPISGADGTAVGTGNQNTTDIITGCVAAGIAAELCYNSTLNGYTDWYLPSKDELFKINLNSSLLGTFTGPGYWTSSEVSDTHAYSMTWSTGRFATSWKSLEGFRVRAVRSF